MTFSTETRAAIRITRGPLRRIANRSIRILWLPAVMTLMIGNSLLGATIDLDIVNPSFEDGNAPFEGAAGWTISPLDEFYTTAGAGLSAGDPDSGQEGPGSQFLTANRLATGDGANPSSSLATQSIDLSAFADDIDAGSVMINLDFFYNLIDAGDNGSVSIEFFDAGNSSLGSLSTGALPETADEVWVAADVAGAVPLNTRMIELQLNASRASGTATNFHVDNFTGSLDGIAIPEPVSMSGWLLLASIFAVFVVRQHSAGRR